MADDLSREEAERAARLEREAGFQDRRAVVAEHEPRERFYWVIAGAYAELEAALRDCRGRRILVVGCGEGGVTPLARAGADVVGIDISERSVEKQREAIAREGLEARARVQVMDAEELDFEPGSFDVVACTGVLHHVDVERACRSWRRVLRPGGELLMVEPLALNPVVALYRRLTPGMRTPDEHPLRPADFRRLRRHFGHVDVHAYGLLSLGALGLAYLGAGPDLRGRVLRGLNAADRALFRLFPPARHLAWTSFIRCREPRTA